MIGLMYYVPTATLVAPMFRPREKSEKRTSKAERRKEKEKCCYKCSLAVDVAAKKDFVTRRKLLRLKHVYVRH